MILYLHGFNSSSASSKAQQTKQYCERMNIDCVAPDLPHRPKEAIEYAKQLCKDKDFVVAIGSSMGGFYTTWLVENDFAKLGVLINPAVKLASKLADQVGKVQQNYSTDATYEFTNQHVEEIKELEIEKIKSPDKYLLLVQTGDEVIDYNEAVDFYAGGKQVVEEGGDHSFVDFERHLPAITRLAVLGQPKITFE